jgi:lysophospholipase L1-like esterase
MGKLALAVAVIGVLAAHAQHPGEHWVATWGAAQQLLAGSGVQAVRPGRPTTPSPTRSGTPQRRFPIPQRLDGLRDQTIRMVVRSSIGGSVLRVRFSNSVGSLSVLFGSASVALYAKDSAIVPGSARPLTFSGRSRATLYGGQVLFSDPVQMRLPPMTELAISVYAPSETGSPAVHLFGLHTSYISKEGDFTSRESIPDASTTESYCWLSGVDVLAPLDTGALVTFGDSITDGDQSTPNTYGMWPAVLAERLQAAQARVGVVNAGIAGNRILGDGSSGLVRLFRDALDQPGVRWLMLLEGINDITAATRQQGAATMEAADLIAAYLQVIAAAHAHGVRVIGCTLTPYGGSNAYRDVGEAIRESVNEWIRISGAFDAVVDFDAATRDPADPKRFGPAIDSPDMLHPANPGYKAMADAIDLSIFRLPGTSAETK